MLKLKLSTTAAVCLLGLCGLLAMSDPCFAGGDAKPMPPSKIKPAHHHDKTRPHHPPAHDWRTRPHPRAPIIVMPRQPIVVAPQPQPPATIIVSPAPVAPPASPTIVMPEQVITAPPPQQPVIVVVPAPSPQVVAPQPIMPVIDPAWWIYRGLRPPHWRYR